MPDNILLDDLDIYILAMEIGEEVWKLVENWGYFQKGSVGKQFVTAADSIASNIAEGYGRFFYKDRKLFYYFARGSLMETKTWALKSFKRKLIEGSEFDALLIKLRALHFKLNIYIKKLKSQGSTNQ